MTSHGKATALRRFLVWCVLAVSAAVLLPAVPAVAAPPTLDDIYKTLKIDNVSADYIILVDESLSMRTNGLYDHVLTSLRQFFAALAPQDGVSLITVADGATVIWEGKAGTSPDALVAKLPPTPTGQHTDLGAGIAAAVDALHDRLHNPIASVVLLTDGQHDPAPGSAYPFTEGYAWQQLTARAKTLTQQVNPYAIQLAGQDGAKLLQKIFPSTKLLATGSIDQLAGLLAQPKEAVRAAKARSLLAKDTKTTVQVSWPTGKTLRDGTNTVTATLHNPSAYVPLDVSDLAVTSDNPAVHVQVAAHGPVHLVPGMSQQVLVTVTWNAGPVGLSPMHTVHATALLRLNGRVSSDWTDLLNKSLGLSLTPALAGTTLTEPGTAQRGSLSWWIVALVGLLILVIVLLWLRWLRLHPVPGGTLSATPLRLVDKGGSIPLQRRRTTINAGSLGIAGAGEVAGRRRNTRSAPLVAISYSDDGTAAGRKDDECELGGTVDINDVRFAWTR